MEAGLSSVREGEEIHLRPDRGDGAGRDLRQETDQTERGGGI